MLHRDRIASDSVHNMLRCEAIFWVKATKITLTVKANQPLNNYIGRSMIFLS